MCFTFNRSTIRHDGTENCDGDNNTQLLFGTNRSFGRFNISRRSDTSSYASRPRKIRSSLMYVSTNDRMNYVGAEHNHYYSKNKWFT